MPKRAFRFISPPERKNSLPIIALQSYGTREESERKPATWFHPSNSRKQSNRHRWDTETSTTRSTEAGKRLERHDKRASCCTFTTANSAFSPFVSISY